MLYAVSTYELFSMASQGRFGGRILRGQKMGLAAIKVKQNFGLDPRNTNWSNDKDRFGHQYLEKMGWTPGRGLGLAEHATTSHVKVSLKDDNVGLGAKLHKKQRKDEFDLGECAGLDAFQRILGRLNGKEDTITDELERQRKDRVINGKWGMHFVKGAVLGSTWDAETKALKKDSTDSSKEQKKSKKRSRDDSDKEKESSSAKKSKIDKKVKRLKTDKIEKGEQKEKKTDKSNKEKRKKDKEEKRQRKLLKRSESDSKEASGREQNKDRSDKKDKKHKKDKKEKTATISLSSEIESSDPPVEKAIASRLSVRSKWIKQKRASVMDAKALNEIFMISK